MATFQKAAFTGIALLLVVVPATAEAPRLVNYQGIVTDSGDVPISGTWSVVFTIYPDSSIIAEPVWSEMHPQVEFENGLFNVLLGSTTPLVDEYFAAGERWLGITVGENPEVSPRMRMTSVPWALRATVADSALASGGGGPDGDWIVSGPDMYSAVPGNQPTFVATVTSSVRPSRALASIRSAWPLPYTSALSKWFTP